MNMLRYSAGFPNPIYAVPLGALGPWDTQYLKDQVAFIHNAYEAPTHLAIHIIIWKHWSKSYKNKSEILLKGAYLLQGLG